MFKKLRRIITTDLVKVTSLTGISTFVKIATSFVSIKVISVLIGPSGVALLGQLNNFSSIFLTISTGGINNGVTRYVAEDSQNLEHTSRYLRSAFLITLVMSLLCGLVLIVGSAYFAKAILHDVKFLPIMIIFGCTIILYAFNGLLISILNGFKEFKKYVIINIVDSLLGLAFSITLVFYLGIYGALLSLVSYQSIIFFSTLFIARKSLWLKWSNFKGKIDKETIIKLSHYSLMALVSAATVPVSQLIVRTYISDQTSLDEAGIWSGMNSISSGYLMIITTSLSVYYLPRLAEIKTDFELRKEILSTFKIIVPAVIVCSIVIYLLRGFIINVFFDYKFVGMKKLFAFQLVGDFFKMCTWILAYQFIAKAMTKHYIIIEITFSALFVGFSILFVNLYGYLGATMAYATNYFVAFFVMLIIFRKLLFNKQHG